MPKSSLMLNLKRWANRLSKSRRKLRHRKKLKLKLPALPKTNKKIKTLMRVLIRELTFLELLLCQPLPSLMLS